jgi:prevent-host-death family protein
MVVDTVQARVHLGDLLNKAQYLGERTTISRFGKPIAALVSLADLRRLEQLTEPGIGVDREASR